MDQETYEEFFRASDARETETVIGLIESKRLGIDEFSEYGAAIHNAAWTGNADLALRLIKLGADVNIANSVDGLTPLHAAVGYNHLAVARALIENGADVNAKTTFAGHSQYTWSPHFGETPLHLATLFCGTEMVEILLDAGANPNLQDGTSATPLDYLKRKTWVRVEQDVKAMNTLLKVTNNG